MERKKASDFPQELLDLFHEYVHGGIDRRAFLDGAGKFAVGGLTAATIFEMLKPNYAWAEQVPKDDKRIRTEYATVPSPQGNGSIKGYLVRPATGTKWPSILVVHENRGLNPYIEDVARRLVTEGYIYPKAQHGFHNDTTPRYDEAAAKLAWQRTLGWFNKYVKA